MPFARENGIKAVCFDIDGTFYPKWRTDLYLVLSALRHPVVSSKYTKVRNVMRDDDGYEPREMGDIAALRRAEAAAMGWKKGAADWEKAYERIFALPWEKWVPRLVKPFPGARGAVAACRKAGLKTACLSDFPLGNKLSALGMEGLFDFQASTEESGHLKPNGTPFLWMLSELGVGPSEALYVGDSVRKDVRGAREVGMRTCLVPGKGKTCPEADLVASDWFEFAIQVLGEGLSEESKC